MRLQVKAGIAVVSCANIERPVSVSLILGNDSAQSYLPLATLFHSERKREWEKGREEKKREEKKKEEVTGRPANFNTGQIYS
uniref:Uncharacterized protein n=1 Tax=Vespula pensylvanica TaxID=30213 RepID=A0A834KQ22_VESPE|nr:hypothetical protein H0235_013455 [Vespula pensylvanica]